MQNFLKNTKTQTGHVIPIFATLRKWSRFIFGKKGFKLTNVVNLKVSMKMVVKFHKIK